MAPSHQAALAGLCILGALSTAAFAVGDSASAAAPPPLRGRFPARCDLYGQRPARRGVSASSKRRALVSRRHKAKGK